MTDAIAVLNTNTTSGSVQEITLSCAELWSIGQQEAIRRLSTQRTCLFTRIPRRHLVSDFSARAARIAATYARFYLEAEQGCNPDYKGRFYWMGLAAFASKQVKCALDFIPDSLWFPLAKAATHVSKDSLGKGNFWLFQDIFVWHWFYTQYPEQFDECAPQRDTSQLVEIVKRNTNSLPWAEKALKTLSDLKLTDDIKEAFQETRNFQKASNFSLKRESQLSSLMHIANHEQINILQPLIYESWLFNRSLDTQAAMEILPLVPKRVAAFTTACDTDDGRFRVQMKKDDNLYDTADRMDFITTIADKYHQLMHSDLEYMESTIRKISSWNNTK